LGGLGEKKRVGLRKILFLGVLRGSAFRKWGLGGFFGGLRGGKALFWGALFRRNPSPRETRGGAPLLARFFPKKGPI